MIAQHSREPESNERSFVVERAAPDDLPALHELIGELAAYERLGHLCIATEADLAVALFGPGPVAEALIAKVDVKSRIACGFALFFHTYSTFAGRRTLWLEDLFVRPEYRGRGLGRRFLQALAVIALERRCGRFDWAVLDWNAPAIAFYESLGASVLPDWRLARITGDSLVRLAGNNRAFGRSADDGE